MANIRFRLRKPKEKNKLQSIYVVYSFGSNSKLYFSINEKTTPVQWSEEKQKIKVGNKKNTRINNILNDLKAVTEKKITDYKDKKEILTKEILKGFLTEYFNPKEKSEKNKDTLFDFIELHIKDKENNSSVATGRKLNIYTLYTYKQTFETLKDYAKSKKIILDFDNLNLDFYNNYINFLQSNNLALNTIGKRIKTLKTFLNSATKQGINKNLAYKDFKVITEKTQNIYLNENELKKIYDFDFSDNKRLEKVRDLFIVGCWTGLRFSDYKQINLENVTKNEIDILTVITQKTGQIVKIPLKKEVKEILTKYNGKAPYNITNQKFNEYVKEVCKEVGINENIRKTITKGGVLNKDTFEKYELVSSHTARRSFATNLYKNNFPAISIMQITGHTTEQSFLSYIKVTKEEHAQLLANHWNNFNKI